VDGAHGGSPLANLLSRTRSALRIGSMPCHGFAISRQSGFDSAPGHHFSWACSNRMGASLPSLSADQESIGPYFCHRGRVKSWTIEFRGEMGHLTIYYADKT
jgi:hypothetical protein